MKTATRNCCIWKSWSESSSVQGSKWRQNLCHEL